MKTKITEEQKAEIKAEILKEKKSFSAMVRMAKKKGALVTDKK